MADTTKISRRDWLGYIERLRKLNDKAADSVKQFVDDKGGTANVDRQDLIDYAYGVATKYGEGAASLSAEMYEAVAMLEGKRVKPAEVADTPTYKEVAKTVNGIIKQSDNTDMLASGVGRLVKRTGIDTVMNNALRDGAEWAWIPSGDSCAFCIMLASQGWVKASRKAIKNGHAEHIHANCDCTYAVRFDSNLEVEGYNPDDYRKIYYGAKGNTTNDKLNYIRRAQNAKSTSRSVTEEGNNIIAKIYDEMRVNGNFGLLPSEEMLKSDSRFFASYPSNQISDATADAFNRAFENLGSKYISSIQKIEPMATEEGKLLKSVPAYVTIDYDTSNRGILKYNPFWVFDEDKLKERVAKAVADKHFVEVAEKDYINYIAVHESAHTLLGNLDNIPKTSLVGGDYTKQRAAQKEINAIFDAYKKELAEKEEIAKRLEKEALTSFEQEIWDNAAKARDEYNKVLLSKYSLENAGEFMAECYVNSEIGTKPNEYAKRVIEVLNRYFSK